jgi:hypothetical protein
MQIYDNNKAIKSGILSSQGAPLEQEGPPLRSDEARAIYSGVCARGSTEVVWALHARAMFRVGLAESWDECD